MDIKEKMLVLRGKSHSQYFRAEIRLCEIYFKAIYKILDMNDENNIHNLRRYFDVIRTEANAACEFFKKHDENEDNMLDLLSNSLYYRLTYVYRNSIILSSAVQYHFKNTLEDNPTILQRIFQKDKIRICSLGCGPASDLVGIIQELEAEAILRGIHLDVRVTAIDLDRNWKNTCLRILNCLDQFRNSIWKIKFIQADLSQFHTIDVAKAIESADIVTMVKFSTEFVQGHLRFTDTVKEITSIMKPGSLLFFLDRYTDHVIKMTDICMEDASIFSLIYEELCDLYTVETSTVETNYYLYNSQFEPHVNNTFLKIFARSWIKFNSSEPKYGLSFEQRFLQRRERYDPLRFFGAKYFKDWEDALIVNMMKAGWSRSGVTDYISNLKRMINELFLSLREKREVMETARTKIIEEKEENKVTDIKNWKNYVDCKNDLATVKRHIYCEEIILFRGNLKRKFSTSSGN